MGLITATFRLSEVQSLKDKRQIIKSMIEQTRNRFGVSVAETGRMDEWKFAQVSAALVSNNPTLCNSVLDKILGYWESNPSVEKVESSVEIL
ncbi:MAG: DUF503 domain-containing protein [Chthonomonadales bacterium]